MKTVYYSVGCMLWLAACSSPAAQNTANPATPKKDSVTITVDSAATSSVHDSAATSSVYEPALFIDEDQTVPPYGLDKVKALIRKIKYVEDPEGGESSTEMLEETQYASLSMPEKFTYHMIHPESYSQNCDPLPIRENEDQRIFGHLKDIFGEYDWSDRQLNFLRKGRDTVIQLMMPLIEKNNRIGGNFKEAIFEMNATEMIPYLIAFYNKEKKDHYILTLLMLLMKENKYPEFMNSASYKKLYAVEEGEYAAYLVYNKANEDLIIQRATNFYDGLHAK
ncbi:hypothetical protein A4H97_32970 [Niastella yeongjuensis]|uniref:DUF4919 domain-containing protein n=1 Tax=Niastella yeongjuensis TaxID=354355 RepID=A0A1V9EGB7_9BACT|nr:hypothetical protein [Niastella yeongjuensis]OQP45153.1 hypothetical protein A4H97_32970 [Niastella yeongjuensis]SEP48558.1 hypothetical protein SAMN05660816_06780 [Niastella yeongjuensis]